MCSFKFHFYLNLPLDVLQELNKLNIKFQYDMVDITAISATIDITTLISSCHFFYPGVDLCLVVQAKIWELFFERMCNFG
jgi:hypothetical protein